jgi:hypothetical protein
MKEGFNSPSLHILAGLGKAEDSFTIEHYFGLAIKELAIQLPDKRQAALIYALAIVEEIINGKRELIVGVAEIKWGAIDSFGFESETASVLFDSIGFENVNGLFYEHDDLTDIIPPLKQDLETIDNVKKELYIELVKWREKVAGLITHP